MSKKDSGYQCFLCGEHIEDKGGVDPCGVDLIANIDKPAEKLNFQRFYCHIKCFKAVNKHASIYKPKYENVEE